MPTRKPTDDTFANRLKQARVERGITLRQIADSTKLSMIALEALERGDMSKLPGGIFSRGFVRSYASAVGLDQEEVVRELIENYPDDSMLAGMSSVQKTNGPDQHDARGLVLIVAIGAALLVAVVAGLLMILGASSDEEPSVVAGSQAIEMSQEPMIFEIAATGSVMLDIVIDGERRESRLVEEGERLDFMAEREISLTASDAGRVRLQINDQPAIQLGAVGEPRHVQIDQTNLSTFLTLE
jgi:hypothetical protein